MLRAGELPQDAGMTRRTPNARLLALSLLVAGACGTVGCNVPEYKEPKGFSSTYHRRLYGPQVAPPAELAAPPAAPMQDPLLKQGVALPQGSDWTQGGIPEQAQPRRYPIAVEQPPRVRR